MLLIALSANFSFSQPAPDWIHTYNQVFSDGFNDIYHTMDGGYVMCGKASEETWHRGFEGQVWVVRITGMGRQTWSHTYGDVARRNSGRSLVETDEGNILVGGVRNNNFTALLIDADGDLIWDREYQAGECNSVIELKSDEFVLAGKLTPDSHDNWVVCIDGDGDIIWSTEVQCRMAQNLWTMRETEGGIVVAGVDQENGANWQIFMGKLNFEGDLLWTRYHNVDNMDYPGVCYEIISDPEGGFVLAGYLGLVRMGGMGMNRHMLMKVDENGEMLWYQRYDLGGDNGPDWGLGAVRMRNGDIVMVGSNANRSEATVIRTNRLGVVRWSNIVEFGDGFGGRYNEFYSVVTTDDNSIIAAGVVTRGNDNDQDGVVMKLEPEIIAPQLIYYSPPDTLLTVLQQDTVTFSVRARGYGNINLTYRWIMGLDTLSRDTTTTVIFDELGEYEVRCLISDGEFTAAITWYVSVVEWYIDAFQPDSTEIILRRGSFIDFTHHARAIEEFEFDYRWEHFGRGGNFEIEGDDSIRFDFDLAGEHLIRAIVSRDDEIQSIEWDINAHSIIWWWWPNELDISVQQDTTVVFEVFPFNEESDSLEYLWCFNEEELESEESLTEIHFPEPGDYEISAYATEGVEADTVRWNVNVLERSYTADDADLSDLPVSPVLYPPSPNPFNSSVKLSLYLPEQHYVLLSVFNVNGREIAKLVNRDVAAGNQTFTWNASDFPAGVYVVRMRAGDESEMRKVVLVR